MQRCREGPVAVLCRRRPFRVLSPSHGAQVLCPFSPFTPVTICRGESGCART